MVQSVGTLRFFLLSLAVAVAIQAQETRRPATDRDKNNWPTVCRIEVPGSRGSMSLGSGTCVYSSKSTGYTYITTAAHVIRDGRGAPRAKFSDGQTLECEVIFNDNRRDVTVLRARGTRPSFTPISDELPKRGENVTFVGYGGERPYFLAYAGPVTGGYGSAPGSGADQLEAYVPQISQGDSGGAVFYKGKLVAIISAKDMVGHGIACLIRYNTIKQSFIVGLDMKAIELRSE